MLKSVIIKNKKYTITICKNDREYKGITCLPIDGGDVIIYIYDIKRKCVIPYHLGKPELYKPKSITNIEMREGITKTILDTLNKYKLLSLDAQLELIDINEDLNSKKYIIELVVGLTNRYC